MSVVIPDSAPFTPSNWRKSSDNSQVQFRLADEWFNVASEDLVASETSARQAADTAEETARIAADNTLQGNINTEAAARIAADGTLTTNLAAEVTNRTTADTFLQAGINAINQSLAGYFPTTYGSDSAWTNASTYVNGNLAGKTYRVIYVGNNTNGGSSYPNSGYIFRSTGTSPEIVYNSGGGFTLQTGYAAQTGDVFIIEGVGVLPANAASQTELDSLKTTLSYVVQTGTPESTNGYFNRTTGVWVSSANYVTLKFNISSLKTLNLKATGKTSGTAMALAVYFDGNNTYLGSEVAGGSSVAYYARQQLTPPLNTVFVALATNTGYTNPPVLENLQYVFPNIPATQSQVATMQTEINQSRTPTYTTLTGTAEAAQGYYEYDNGLYVNQSFWYTTKYDISALTRPNLLATGRVNGTNSALVVYFSAENVYLGYEVRGTSTATPYNRQALTPPTGTKFVAVSSNGSAFPVKLENIVYVAPDIPAIETLKTSVTSLNSDMQQLKSPVYTTQTGTVNPTQGYYAYNTGVFSALSSYYSTMYDIQGVSGTPYATGRTNGTAMALAVYFDTSNVYLGYEYRGGSSATVRTRVLLTPPAGTRYIAVVSNGSAYPPILEMLTYVLPNLSNIGLQNQWSGKKVVWMGTSVPFGQNSTKSYALEAATKLGFTLVNTSTPGQAIHIKTSGEIQADGSTAMTIAEYAANGVTISNTPYTWTPGMSLPNNYYRTYEHIIVPENADADLWVLDIVPNNGTTALNNTADWDLFDKSAWAYTDGSTFADHRKTVLGAMLFLMDKIYTLNPNARILLLSASSFNYTNGVNMFNTLVNQYKIAYVDIWKKINTTPPSLAKIKSLSGTDDHPSTFAHGLLGNMLTNEFLLIS